METNNPSDKRNTMTVAYQLNEALYLNITNRCPNNCVFCIRNTAGGVGYNLWLEREPEAEEIIAAIGDPSIYKEIVFCGYGEPLLRPEVIIAVAKWLKNRPSDKKPHVRLNTNGLSDIFLERDILPELEGLIDVISISLNAHNDEAYTVLTRTGFKQKAFPAVLEFARRSVRYIPRVILSVVRYSGVDIEKAGQIAKEMGVEFRVREYQE